MYISTKEGHVCSSVLIQNNLQSMEKGVLTHVSYLVILYLSLQGNFTFGLL